MTTASESSTVSARAHLGRSYSLLPLKLCVHWKHNRAAVPYQMEWDSKDSKVPFCSNSWCDCFSVPLILVLTSINLSKTRLVFFDLYCSIAPLGWCHNNVWLESSKDSVGRPYFTSFSHLTFRCRWLMVLAGCLLLRGDWLTYAPLPSISLQDTLRWWSQSLGSYFQTFLSSRCSVCLRQHISTLTLRGFTHTALASSWVPDYHLMASCKFFATDLHHKY